MQQRQSRQPAPQRSRLEVVRACVRAVRIGAQNREGGSCGGGFPAGGAGGAGRRTVAWLASVSIATTEAVGAAAVAVSSAPLWRGGDESDRLRRKRRARGERGVGAGAQALGSLRCLIFSRFAAAWAFCSSVRFDFLPIQAKPSLQSVMVVNAHICPEENLVNQHANAMDRMNTSPRSGWKVQEGLAQAPLRRPPLHSSTPDLKCKFVFPTEVANRARVSNPPDCADPGLHPDQRRDQVAKRPNTGATAVRASVEGSHLLSGFAQPSETMPKRARRFLATPRVSRAPFLLALDSLSWV